jgi:hypothetical protein
MVVVDLALRDPSDHAVHRANQHPAFGALERHRIGALAVGCDRERVAAGRVAQLEADRQADVAEEDESRIPE